MHVPDPTISRRRFVTGSAASMLLGSSTLGGDNLNSTRQASGVKAGEVTNSSAIVWTRLTAASTRNAEGKPGPLPAPKDGVRHTDAEVAKLPGACPGARGRIRVRYGTDAELKDAGSTPWADALGEGDFAQQFMLTKLPADKVIHFVVETTDAQKMSRGTVRGQFRTAPAEDADTAITFAAVTCQGYDDLDHADGFHIYEAIKRLEPRFVTFSGDNVYYDNERPYAHTPALARYHWERMYSLPRHVELLRSVATYWQKDDHDTLKNDSWAGQKFGDLTFAEGQMIFRQQVPMGDSIYRTFRWGKHLQVWLTDGRDFRTPNNMKDGPKKTIWGDEQKAWLFRTLKESNATWKVLISPTPIVGPDRENKGDNHANKNFKHEGDEARKWFREHVPSNFFVVCGDRHWQYHSVHPETGLNEFSIGAASDPHAGGSPGFKKDYHRFHRVKGGFISVAVDGSSIKFRHHDVHGKVMNEHEIKRA